MRPTVGSHPDDNGVSVGPGSWNSAKTVAQLLALRQTPICVDLADPGKECYMDPARPLDLAYASAAPIPAPDKPNMRPARWAPPPQRGLSSPAALHFLYLLSLYLMPIRPIRCRAALRDLGLFPPDRYDNHEQAALKGRYRRAKASLTCGAVVLVDPGHGLCWEQVTVEEAVGPAAAGAKRPRGGGGPPLCIRHADGSVEGVASLAEQRFVVLPGASPRLAVGLRVVVDNTSVPELRHLAPAPGAPVWLEGVVVPGQGGSG
jgi:hypothetical protein